MPLYNYEIGKVATLTGTAAINGTVNVVGTSTLALTELASGDIVVLNGEARIVNVITDNTHWTVTTAFSSTASGLPVNGVSMKNLESELGLALAALASPPRGGYSPYSIPLDLGNSMVRGGGWATDEWRWGFLSQAERNALRVYCTGASAEVYIRTRVYDNSDAYKYFSAIMIWPPGPEPRQAGRRLDFSIKFQALVEVS